MHLLPEGAEIALCGRDRVEFGATVWDAGAAAPDLCRECSVRMLALTDDAVEMTATAMAERTREKTTEDYTRIYETAKDALRGLARVVPAGATADLVIYARACLVRGDPAHAYESLRTWRANMRAIGVFAAD